MLNYNNEKNTLIVGVSSDQLNFNKKNKFPIIPLQHRIKLVENIKGVKEVFVEESLEQKRENCLKYNADILIMGDDHKGRFDFLESDNIKVVYVSRTPEISTTKIIGIIKA